MEALLRDLRTGLRSLTRRPAFTATSALILALGIGGGTALLALLQTVFDRPIPVADLSRLVAAFRTTRGAAGDYAGFDPFSYPDYRDFASRAAAVAELALFQWQPVNLAGGDQPQRVGAMFVTANYFAVLGLRPARGRFFTREEGMLGRLHLVGILSHGCWHRLFAGDPKVLGRRLIVNGHDVEVVGVGPVGFQGTELHHGADLWVPLPVFGQLSPYGKSLDDRGFSMFSCVARLRPHVAVGQACARLAAISRQLAEEFPDTDKDSGATAVPLAEASLGASFRERYVGFGKTLLLAFALSLLVACVSVSNLLVWRGLEAARDLSLYHALGANRAAMMRLRLCESMLIFALGGLLSLPAALWTLRLLWSLRPPELAQATLDLGLGGRAYAFSWLLTAVALLIFGTVPAIRSARPDIQAVLRGTAGETGGRRRRWRTPAPMVSGQMALALVALVAASLFLRSLRAATQVRLGFDPRNLLALSVAPGDQGYGEVRGRQFYDQLLLRVAGLPGVQSATLSENRLLRGGIRRNEVFGDGDTEPVRSGASLAHRINVVVPGFFRTAGIPLDQGRDFDAADCAECRKVAIVNRTMAQALWPGRNALGRRFHLIRPDSSPVEVVGVAEDMRYREVFEKPGFFIYLPLAQNWAPAMVLHVRTRRDPRGELPAIVGVLRSLDRNLPVADVDTMEEFVARALWFEHASARLLSCFGLLALSQAVVGIYALTAQWARRRQHEIGIRCALGATKARLLRLLVGEAALVVAEGLLVGWALAFLALRPALSAQMHGVAATDPASYLGQAAILAAAALLASWAAFSRAASRDAAAALRTE